MAAVEHILLSTEQYERLTKRLRDKDNENDPQNIMKNNKHTGQSLSKEKEKSSDGVRINGDTLETKEQSKKLTGKEEEKVKDTPSINSPSKAQVSNPISFNQVTVPKSTDTMAGKEQPEKLLKETRIKKGLYRSKKKRSTIQKQASGSPLHPLVLRQNKKNMTPERFLPPGKRSISSFEKTNNRLSLATQKWVSL